MTTTMNSAQLGAEAEAAAREACRAEDRASQLLAEANRLLDVAESKFIPEVGAEYVLRADCLADLAENCNAEADRLHAQADDYWAQAADY